MKLSYTAINIANAEDLRGKSFLGVLADLGEIDMTNPRLDIIKISPLLFLLEAGGITREEASDIVDNEGIEKALGYVFEALQNAGFLAQKKQTEAKATAKTEEATATSETSGQTTKN
nr:MAG TPA: tail assembly chaperone protein [Caudoviricetes sp.]